MENQGSKSWKRPPSHPLRLNVKHLAEATCGLKHYIWETQGRTQLQFCHSKSPSRGHSDSSAGLLRKKSRSYLGGIPCPINTSRHWKGCLKRLLFLPAFLKFIAAGQPQQLSDEQQPRKHKQCRVRAGMSRRHSIRLLSIGPYSSHATIAWDGKAPERTCSNPCTRRMP